MFDAVIVDLDGTLVDTERLWMRAIDGLVARLGRTPDPTVHAIPGRSRSASGPSSQSLDRL